MISTVSCLFVYIVVRFQIPIDRDITTSIGYVQLSERYYRTHDTTALTSSAIILFEYVLTIAQEIELFWQ